ncbi:MAG: acetyl-CoA carboxylase biotin carboxyl carrier protein subunit [Bacteroidales bacterium]|nr:acetyl-CoA carboxylase biotin carboxyl carrier protein subunit [Bacteroidales bacterium]
MKLTRKKIEEAEYIAVSSQDKRYKIRNPFSEDLKINGKKTEIKIFDDENGFTYILYKRKKYLAEILERSQNKYTVLINGVSYVFTIETPISYKRKKYLDKTKSKSTHEMVQAPMPGKIVDILVDAGTDVKEGEALLILEAMKMQNEISSPVTGKVTNIVVRKNDVVNKEDVLVELEKK